MKNKRYLDEAIKNICDERHPHVNQETIKSSFLAIYEEAQKIAIEKSETVDFDIEPDALHELMLLAHKKDITLNQLVEQALEEAVAEAEKNLHS